MAKGINQKGKILYLEKILRETSETHPCTMQEIIGKLQENGVSAERKSIYDDMEVLRSFGMDIKFKRGKYTGYYVAGEAAAESVSAAITEMVQIRKTLLQIVLEQRLRGVYFPARLIKKQKIPGCFHHQILRRINQ